MFAPMALASTLLIVVFVLIDAWQWRLDKAVWPESGVPRRLEIAGAHNGLYLAAIIGMVLISGLWRSGWTVPLGFGVGVHVEGLLRDTVLLVVAYLSWRTTPRRVRIENAFTWVPIREVAILFLGIFVTIVPVLAVLQAGAGGPLAPLIRILTQADGQPNDAAYFLGVGGTVELSRQRADIPRVFQCCRR